MTIENKRTRIKFNSQIRDFRIKQTKINKQKLMSIKRDKICHQIQFKHHKTEFIRNIKQASDFWLNSHCLYSILSKIAANYKRAVSENIAKEACEIFMKLQRDRKNKNEFSDSFLDKIIKIQRAFRKRVARRKCARVKTISFKLGA